MLQRDSLGSSLWGGHLRQEGAAVRRQHTRSQISQCRIVLTSPEEDDRDRHGLTRTEASDMATLIGDNTTLVAAVSRSTDKLDIFTSDTLGRIWTAAWRPGFTQWVDRG